MVSGQTTLVMFGGTGDLFRRKLLPALLSLHTLGKLPKVFNIVGVSRTSKTNEEYREFVRKVLEDKHGVKDVDGSFLNRFYFTTGTIGEKKMCDDLKAFLEELDKEQKICTNKMFYLAIPPLLYEPVFEHLKVSGLSESCSKENWTRILVEKPFGYDKEEAARLDSLLGELFEEEQIFRIDHYLAKETVQNLITFRFANSVFEPLWSREYVESIDIKMYEKLDSEGRGSFYDGIGGLRDVGQNHALQLLALITMEDPGKLGADGIREKRAELLSQIVPMKVDENHFIRAQYEGFRDEEGVDNESDTETFFKVGLEIQNPRWQGVPVSIEAGKALSDYRVDLTVTFKEGESCVCPEGDVDHKNMVRFRIQPDEGIHMRFWTKKPGFEYELLPKELSFCYNDSDESIPDAYQRVLYDCIRGDQTLFTSTKEVEAQWNVVMPILNTWRQLPLRIYKKGSNPEEIL